jgi:hypothetical protein
MTFSMAAAFVKIVDGLTVPPGPLQQFTSRRDFAEFPSSSVPIFALEAQVSELDLKQAADKANEQACAELCFDDAELAEMGYAAAVPQPWQLHERALKDVVRWYHEDFNKSGPSSTDNVQWYPLAFPGIDSADWRATGAVLVFYDARSRQSDNEDVVVKAYRVDSNQIGPTLISLRQGHDDHENVKRWSAMS